MRPGITRFQIFVVIAGGVFSGIYIWKPLFEENRAKAIAEAAKDKQ